MERRIYKASKDRQFDLPYVPLKTKLLENHRGKRDRNDQNASHFRIVEFVYSVLCRVYRS